MVGLNDVMEAAKGRDEVVFSDVPGGICCSYMVAFPDTFKNPVIKNYARGAVFSKETGEVIRLPFPKFFNVNEVEETQIHLLRQKKIVAIADKLDGAMIAPYLDGWNVVWGTKRVAKDFHESVVKFLEESGLHDDYMDFVWCCFDDGLTPIFEYHNPEFEPSVIVVRYDKAFLRLIGIRDMKTGKLHTYQHIKRLADSFGIECVDCREYEGTIDDLVATIPENEGAEGIVIQFDDGQLVKLKTKWYVERHKLIDVMRYKRHQCALILGESTLSYDDILPLLTDEQRHELDAFGEHVHELIEDSIAYVEKCVEQFDSPKDFGLYIKENGGTVVDRFVFESMKNGGVDREQLFLKIKDVFAQQSQRSETNFLKFIGQMKHVKEKIMLIP